MRDQFDIQKPAHQALRCLSLLWSPDVQKCVEAQLYGKGTRFFPSSIGKYFLGDGQFRPLQSAQRQLPGRHAGSAIKLWQHPVLRHHREYSLLRQASRSHCRAWLRPCLAKSGRSSASSVTSTTAPPTVTFFEELARLDHGNRRR
jgi:hypothetical protein